MLKIKNNIDLKELEKYGFNYRFSDKKECGIYSYVTYSQLSYLPDFFYISVCEKTREIEFFNFHHDCKVIYETFELLLSMFNDGILEIVRDKKYWNLFVKQTYNDDERKPFNIIDFLSNEIKRCCVSLNVSLEEGREMEIINPQARRLKTIAIIEKQINAWEIVKNKIDYENGKYTQEEITIIKQAIEVE